jgi:hypothetical protein
MLTVVGVVALALRLAFLFRAPVFIIGDSENYFWPGYELARQIGFDLELRRTPVYPLFITFVVREIGEDLVALALAQHVLGIGTALLAAWLGLRFWGVWTGLLAGLLVALSGPLLVAEQYVMAEALFIPLAMLTVAWLALAIERPAWWLLLMGGVLIGLSALTRPVGLVLAVAAVLAVPVAEWRRWGLLHPDAGTGLALATEDGGRARRATARLTRVARGTVVRALPIVAGVLLIWVGWMFRNWMVQGTFSAEGNAGQTLVGRAMRHDSGFAFENPNDPDPVRQRAREIMRRGRGGFVSPTRDRLMKELGLSEAEANKLMRDLSLETIERQPGYYLLGTAQRFLRLAVGTPERYRDHWQTRKDAGSREEWEANENIRALLGPPTPLQESQYAQADALINLFQPSRWGPLIPLLTLVGAVGLALGIGSRAAHPGSAALLVLVVVGLLLAAVALVAPIARYRYPAEPLLSLLAAGGITTLVAVARRAVRDRRLLPGESTAATTSSANAARL